MATLQHSASQVGLTHMDANPTAFPPHRALRHHRRSCHRVWPPSLEIKLARLSIDEGRTPPAHPDTTDTHSQWGPRPNINAITPPNHASDADDAMIQSAYARLEQNSSMAFHPDTNPAVAAVDDMLLLPPLKRAPSFSSASTSTASSRTSSFSYLTSSRQSFARAGETAALNYSDPNRGSRPASQIRQLHNAMRSSHRMPIEFQPTKHGDVSGGLNILTSPEVTPHIHPLDTPATSLPSPSTAAAAHAATTMFSTSASMAIDPPLSSSLETGMMDLVVDETEFGQDLFMRAPSSRAASLVDSSDAAALVFFAPTSADTEPYSPNVEYRHLSLDDLQGRPHHHRRHRDHQHHHHYHRHSQCYSEADVFTPQEKHSTPLHHHNGQGTDACCDDSDDFRQYKRHQSECHHRRHHRRHQGRASLSEGSAVSTAIPTSTTPTTAAAEGSILRSEEGASKETSQQDSLTYSVVAFDVDISPFLAPHSPPLDFASLTISPSTPLQEQLWEAPLPMAISPLLLGRELLSTPWLGEVVPDRWQESPTSFKDPDNWQSLLDDSRSRQDTITITAAMNHHSSHLSPAPREKVKVKLEKQGDQIMDPIASPPPPPPPLPPNSLPGPSWSPDSYVVLNEHVSPQAAPPPQPLPPVTDVPMASSQNQARRQPSVTCRRPPHAAMMPVIVEGEPALHPGSTPCQGCHHDEPGVIGATAALPSSSSSSSSQPPIIVEEDREAMSMLFAELGFQGHDLHSDVPMAEAHEEFANR